MIIKYWWISGMIFLPTLVCAEQFNVNVKIKVVKPPCTINAGQPIDINFGDVKTNAIDGYAYQLPVTYSLYCGGAGTTALKMQISGIKSSFNNAAVEVQGRPEMGIQFMHNGTPLEINTWFNFNYSNTAMGNPKLYVVPVKKVDSTLTEGAFTATATMLVDYQ